jgi:signal transduction histidine kinase
MAAIDFLQRRAVEIAWFAFATANLAAMVAWPSWETIPFHLIWISLTLLYGFRVWEPASTGVVLGLVIAATGALILSDAFSGDQLWGELFEVPLMAAMFLAMVWHARRRQDALRKVEHEAAERAALLAQQRRFLHDVSHELRTPVTIARGHLEVLRRLNGRSSQEVDVALDELGRIEQILERLLLLAKSKQPDFVVFSEIEVEPFFEDVFVRWSGVVPRSWRLGKLAPGTVRADPDALRIVLDALLENAVKYTQPQDAITLAERLAADRGRRRGPGPAAGGGRAHLRALRPRRQRPLPCSGRRRTRPRDRGRHRESARRRLLGQERRRRRRLHDSLSWLCSSRGPRISLPSRPRRSQLTLSSASWR